MRYGQKWLGKHRKMGSTYCAQCCPVFISSKNSVKIWPKKKLLRHRRYAALRRGSKSHFSQKNAFFGQKKAFFWKIHFIQNSSVTKNTSFTCFNFFFFTKLWVCNFHQILPIYVIYSLNTLGFFLYNHKYDQNKFYRTTAFKITTYSESLWAKVDHHIQLSLSIEKITKHSYSS